jgi:transcriptional regulator with XRE-family HTH domain
MAKRQDTLAALVAERGLGLQDLAERARVGRTSLWRWMTGESAPRIPQQRRLADALGIAVERVRAAVEAGRHS